MYKGGAIGEGVDLNPTPTRYGHLVVTTETRTVGKCICGGFCE